MLLLVVLWLVMVVLLMVLWLVVVLLLHLMWVLRLVLVTQVARGLTLCLSCWV